jgi:Leucine Rich repeat
VVALANALQMNQLLQILNLSSNKIGANGAVALANALLVNQSLKKLDFGKFVNALNYITELSHLSLNAELSLDANLAEEMSEELLLYNYTLKVFGDTNVEEI